MNHNELAIFIILTGILIWVIINTQQEIMPNIINNGINDGINEGYLDMPIIFWPLDYKYGETNIHNTNLIDNNVNTLFSAHPNRLVCSNKQNELMKHARLHSSGNVMYTSYHKPTESKNCKVVSCPPLVNMGITPKDRDHFNPYPLRRDKLTCWDCN